MTLNDEQRKKVEENMGLVGKVIKDKIHGINQMGIYSQEDLMQIGYLGLRQSTPRRVRKPKPWWRNYAP